MLAWLSLSVIRASTQPHSELYTLLRCHSRLLKNLTKLDLAELRDRRFPLLLTQLAQLPHLRSLYLPPLLKIEADSLVSCQQFNLLRLRLSGSTTLENSQLSIFLLSQPLLKTLDIGFCKLLDQSILDTIAKLKDLHTLHLEGCQNMFDLSPLLSLTSLRKLYLHVAEVEDMAFKNFSTFTCLELLDIQGTKTTEEVIPLLPPNLSFLRLAEGSVSDWSSQHLKRLSKLTNLEIVKCPALFGTGYAQFSGAFPNLARLELRTQPPLMDDEWKFISTFRNLTSLSIIDMRLAGDPVLANLTQLYQVSKIAISPNQISHLGLHMISQLPITSLYLKNGSLLDDSALPILFDCFLQIEDLNLQLCPLITPTAQTALRAHAQKHSIKLSI